MEAVCPVGDRGQLLFMGYNPQCGSLEAVNLHLLDFPPLLQGLAV